MGDGSFIAFRPEVALRRAKDHENIGQMHEACAHLHDVLVSKRMGRLWNINHEKMMIEFINLCTDLRETRRTKDGLYHYRQLTQMQNPQSLEKVVHHMIDSAQVRAAEAKARFFKESGAPAGVSNVEDLEEEEQSPESLLMGAVTSEGSKERLEREILVPWLRHVWDTFRNVLENIRYVPRLENLYHSTVIKAMQFCKNYSRTAEFKKLCNMLRNHLLAQRRSQDNNGVVMTQEQIERHLNTRFVQLEHCAELNLWTEGFRTVEDIFGIMALSDAAPRAQLMATYYEKLARIFWVSENYLFHAYAWYKFFSLSFTQNKSLNDEDKRNMASAVLLAALAIPVYAAGPGTSAAYNTETAGTPLEIDRERDKKFRLASLLKHEAATSREALITEIVSKGVLRNARPEVASLFHLLEEEFAPLALISRAEPCLAQLRQEIGPTLSSAGTLGGSASALAHSLAQYVPNLEKLLVFRTLQQLGKVYSLFKLQTFRNLISQLEIGFHDTEKMITRAVKNRLLAVRLNHRQGCIRFGDDSAENVASRRHLTLLAARLQSIVQAFNAGTACNPLAERIPQMFNLARESLSISQHVVLERKLQIDAIKEQKQKELQEKARWVSRKGLSSSTY
jgi:translation initiation factor 3 subunit A